MNSKTIQKQFAKSKACRRAIKEYCRENGIDGDCTLILEAMQEIIETYSDNQIRDLCNLFLKCYDIKEAEKRDLLHILCI